MANGKKVSAICAQLQMPFSNHRSVRKMSTLSTFTHRPIIFVPQALLKPLLQLTNHRG